MIPFVFVDCHFQHRIMIFYTESHLLPKSNSHVKFRAQKEWREIVKFEFPTLMGICP